MSSIIANHGDFSCCQRSSPFLRGRNKTHARTLIQKTTFSDSLPTLGLVDHHNSPQVASGLIWGYSRKAGDERVGSGARSLKGFESGRSCWDSFLFSYSVHMQVFSLTPPGSLCFCSLGSILSCMESASTSSFPRRQIRASLLALCCSLEATLVHAVPCGCISSDGLLSEDNGRATSLLGKESQLRSEGAIERQTPQRRLIMRRGLEHKCYGLISTENKT